MAGFGKRLGAQLLEPLPAQLQGYAALLARWPERLPSPVRLSFAHAGLALEDWLGDLHANGDALARLELQPGGLKRKDRSYKWHRLLRPWVGHVVAAACGHPLTTLLVAEDVRLAFAPLTQAEAEQLLRQWLDAYAVGMQVPLPVAIGTVAAWFAQLDKSGDEDKAAEAARKVYEGDGHSTTGEVQQSASLARQYPDFDALLGDGRFAQWGAALYQSLFEAAISELQDDQP